MAYSAWLNPSKTEGSGNDSVSVGALSDNTGRNARTTTITFKAANCSDVERTVSQAGKTEFVTIQSTAAIEKTGGNLTITGTSNSSKLTFSIGTSPAATLTLTVPSDYTANGVSTTNGTAITGDPGATAQYTFSVTFSSVPANATINDLTAQLVVTSNGGTTATCAITQAAGDPTLSVSPASVTLPWNAYTNSNTESFTVTTNTTWTVV